MACTTLCSAQKTKGKAKSWKWQISNEGYLDNIIFKNGNKNDTVAFFHGNKAKGPAFYINNGNKDIVGKWVPKEFGFFESTIDNVECRIHYQRWKGMPSLEITIRNNGKDTFNPTKAGIKLGIDTYMDKYPDWLSKYFPTLMRNEQTHFFGYFQTPSGKTLGIVSPQPVASWSVDYNLGYQDPAPHWFMGHRIESLNIDLMNALPLPDHNPQNLTTLQPGESKRWIIAFVPIDKPDLFEVTIHQTATFPMIKMNQTSFNPNETASFDVIAQKPSVNVFDDEGKELNVNIKLISKDIYRVKCNLPKIGLYKIIVNAGKYQAEGMLTAHSSYQWTLEEARKAALKYHQKATSHAESWYGFYSAFIAARYFPDAELDKALSKRFDYLYNMLHDTISPKPLYHASRIQNTSTTIGMLIDKYKAEKHIKDLKTASLLGDWLMNTWQRKSDGAYINHGTIYTSVIYVAKSMLELALAEQQAAKYDITWSDASLRHYQSAKRAIDQLVASNGDFQTEGELTFEDGMVSCSALQIGMLALMQTDKKERQHYTKAMVNLLESHNCLTQLRVPDARRRGGTMRYWEAQYDVQMLPNMFNSPHGWSGWRAYATYYAYLLTGNEKWLLQTYNAMGAFSNLIDYKTGDLRWAFVVDPYVKVKQACSADPRYTADSLSFGNPHPELYKTKSFVIGEQYVNMISDWQTINVQDNDVHELFKCMEESMLANAFIVERPNGDVVGYNCKVNKTGSTIYVESNEKQIKRLHCNMKNSFTVSFNGKSRELPDNYLGWAFGTDNYLFKIK
jgi:hypothetical protein